MAGRQRPCQDRLHADHTRLAGPVLIRISGYLRSRLLLERFLRRVQVLSAACHGIRKMRACSSQIGTGRCGRALAQTSWWTASWLIRMMGLRVAPTITCMRRWCRKAMTLGCSHLAAMAATPTRRTRWNACMTTRAHARTHACMHTDLRAHACPHARTGACTHTRVPACIVHARPLGRPPASTHKDVRNRRGLRAASASPRPAVRHVQARSSHVSAMADPRASSSARKTSRPARSVVAQRAVHRR